MDIKEALEQIKETSAQFIVSIEGLIAFIGNSQAEVEGIVNAKAELEKSIVDLQSELSAAKEANFVQLNSMAENIENAKRNQKENLRSLKEQFNKEFEEINMDRTQKITELDAKVSELASTGKTLAKDILEKQKFLESLNQSIEAIKSKLNR